VGIGCPAVSHGAAFGWRRCSVRIRVTIFRTDYKVLEDKTAMCPLDKATELGVIHRIYNALVITVQNRG
jgi:hypothetical protein